MGQYSVFISPLHTIISDENNKVTEIPFICLTNLIVFYTAYSMFLNSYVGFKHKRAPLCNIWVGVCNMNFGYWCVFRFNFFPFHGSDLNTYYTPFHAILLWHFSLIVFWVEGATTIQPTAT
jgi:hypothetical protein